MENEPMPTFAVGDRVRVILGLAQGLEGEVVSHAHDFAKKIPAYKVRLPGLLHVRVLRADYLERVTPSGM